MTTEILLCFFWLVVFAAISDYVTKKNNEKLAQMTPEEREKYMQEINRKFKESELNNDFYCSGDFRE